MSQNDTIIIGPFRYNVLKREKNRMLVSWIESTGIYKETWILLKSCYNNNGGRHGIN